MAELTLGLWIVTALLGTYLFMYASDGGRPESTARATHLPPLVLFLHPVLGVLGIGVWIAYLSADSVILAWVGVAVLTTGIAVGAYLGLRTEGPRKEDEARLVALAGRGSADPETVADLTVAEQQIPKPAILVHGLGAAATLALAVTVAIRAL